MEPAEADRDRLDPTTFSDWPAPNPKADVEELERGLARRRQGLVEALQLMVAHAVATVPPARLPAVVAAYTSLVLVEIEGVEAEFQPLLIAKRRMQGGADRERRDEAYQTLITVGRLMRGKPGLTLEKAAADLADAVTDEQTVCRRVRSARRRIVKATVAGLLKRGEAHQDAIEATTRELAKLIPVASETVARDWSS